jgi:type IV secretion system protein VirD4
MIPYIAMHDYIREAIDTYPKEIDPDLSEIIATFNQKFSPYHFLIKSNWEPIHDKEKQIRLNFTKYNCFCFFSKRYDLLIDICQNPKNFDLIINWYIESAISPIQSIEPNPIQEKIDAFKLYSILNYGGNARKTAIEFLRHRPNLHHFFGDLGINPNNIPNILCKYPPQPLLPRKLTEQFVVDFPVIKSKPSETNPTQSSGFTVDKNNQLTNPYSSTDFTSFSECETLKYCNNEGDGIPIGIYHHNNTIRYKGDSHLITIAPTGSGKNTAVQIPTLLEYNASALVIDPKGECAIISARCRKEMGHEVIILNPFNILQKEFSDIKIAGFHGFNPLAHLKVEEDNFVADISTLSEAIVVTASNEPYWSDSARDLISCLIMYVCIADEEKENRHLPRVRELLTQNEVNFLSTMILISKSDFLPMAQKSRRFLVEDEKSNSSIIATAITQTLFLDEPKLKENLTRNDFNFLDMKTKAMTVYVILPAKFLIAYSRWFRVLVTSALDSLMSTHKKSTKPILIMIDEFPILGYLTSLETAIGLARGYGIQIWIFIQDIHQLNHIYGNRAESFLANTGVQQYFTPNDIATAERISKRMGDMTIYEQKATEVMNTGELKHIDFSVKERPLMYPIDIIGFENDLQIVFFSGNKKPVVLYKNYYYQNNSYIDDGVKRYDNNPYRSE